MDKSGSNLEQRAGGGNMSLADGMQLLAGAGKT
jgi:hypothetical protein